MGFGPQKKGPNPKQTAFAHEYLIDLNSAQAAIRAGYSPKGAKVRGFKLLQRADVQKIIQDRANERIKKIDVDADYVLFASKEILERCMQRVPVMEKIDGELAPTGEWKFDSAGACKAAKLLGDHIAVGAFKATDDNGVPIDNNWVVTFVDASPKDTEKT